MFEKYLYSTDTIIENAGRIEPFSFGIGVGIGVILSAGQALIQYITNTQDPAFLGMGFINLVMGLGLIIAYVVIRRWVPFRGW